MKKLCQKIINRLEGERPTSFKWIWGLTRSSASCFGNQTAGNVTENENSQRQCTFTPQSTRQEAQEAAERRQGPLPSADLAWHIHFLQNFERQEETWGEAEEQIQSLHRQPPLGTKSLYLLQPSKEGSFQSKHPLNLIQAILCPAGTPGHKEKVSSLPPRSVPSSILRLCRWNFNAVVFF